MKIWEIVENLNAGAGSGSTGVGNAGSETFFMHPSPKVKKMKQIPQVGYGIKIGNMIVPTSRYNPDNDRGQLNKVEGG
jgi:hypothetical protein